MSQLNGFGNIEKVNVSGFELRKFGSLRQGELEWFDNQSKKRLSSLVPIYKLASTIATDLGIEKDVALGLIQGTGDSELYQKVLLVYSTELFAAKEQTYSETDSQRDICTMMLQSRLSKSYLRDNAAAINEFLEIDMDAINPQWTSEFTSNLPLNLVAEIIAFTTSERTEWVPETVKTGEGEVTPGK